MSDVVMLSSKTATPQSQSQLVQSGYAIIGSPILGKLSTLPSFKLSTKNLVYQMVNHDPAATKNNTLKA